MARGHIREVRPGTWELRVYAGRDGDGRKRYRVRRVAGTRRDAEDTLALLLAGVAEGGRQVAAKGTVADLLERFYAVRSSDWAPSTARETRRIIDDYLIPGLGHLDYRKVDTAAVDGFYARLRTAGRPASPARRRGRPPVPLGPGTVRRAHGVLRAAFEQAITWGWRRDNPAARARPGKVRREHRDVPTPVEALRIADAADTPEFVLFVELAARTGARRGELCRLRFADVDLDAGEMILRKTKTVPRIVPLEEDVVRALRTHHVAMRERALALGMRLARAAYVFSDDPGCAEPWDLSSTSRRFRRAAERARLEGYTLHDLRHGYITHLGVQGVDPATIARLVGHARPSTTLDVYSHRVRAAERDAARLAGELYRRAT